MFFGLLLAGLNLMGTSVATEVLASSQRATSITRVLIIIGLPLILHLAGCGFMLLFEKTVHPWRQLGKERERHCWGKLQGTKKGIVAEPTVWDQVRTNSLVTF